jgi:predicted dehydrogenase
MSGPVRIGLLGSGFIAAIHAESIARTPGASLAAVASPSPGNAEALARRWGAPRSYTDPAEMIDAPDVDAVVVASPNDTHAALTLAAARAGKHVLCEKPLCLSLAEADAMVEACRSAGVMFMYAEELCFAPKYVRLKQLLDSGALGEPTLLKQSEKHDGPHAPHFWDVDRSGGGVAMDMGCHAIAYFRWMLDNRPVRSVYAQLSTQVHGARTRGDDNALILLEFEGGCLALAEESWTKPGGMDDRAEVHGSEGVAYADLLHGNSITTYSRRGYDYAVEKAGSTAGWSFTIYEEAWNYGFPQEIAHFVDCVAHGRTPLVTGADGRAVLEVLFAAYASAGQGRKVHLPFHTDAPRPIDLWRPA